MVRYSLTPTGPLHHEFGPQHLFLWTRSRTCNDTHKRVEWQLDRLFDKVNDDVRSAVEITRSLGRTPSTERLVEVCRVGLKQILG
jgi:hypothetical protein